MRALGHDWGVEVAAALNLTQLAQNQKANAEEHWTVLLFNLIDLRVCLLTLLVSYSDQDKHLTQGQ